jgi:hypothetical protein
MFYQCLLPCVSCSYGMIYLLTAIGLTPGGSSTVHVYTQTIHRTTKITTNLEECRPCPVFASFTLAFSLQMSKKHGKTSVRVVVYILPKHPRNTKHTHAHMPTHYETHTYTHTHTLQNNMKPLQYKLNKHNTRCT